MKISRIVGQDKHLCKLNCSLIIIARFRGSASHMQIYHLLASSHRPHRVCSAGRRAAREEDGIDVYLVQQAVKQIVYTSRSPLQAALSSNRDPRKIPNSRLSGAAALVRMGSASKFLLPWQHARRRLPENVQKIGLSKSHLPMCLLTCS